MQNSRAVLILAIAVVATASAAKAAPPAFQPLKATGSLIEAGAYRLDLGEADDPNTPRAWQGPIKIAGPGRRSCTVTDDVSIIEAPFALSAHRFIYITTYSGSETVVYVVDGHNCAVKWKSQPFTGAPIFLPTELLLREAGRTAIKSTGLPSP